MNWDLLQNRLIQTARRQSPADAVPYAFERRVLARLCQAAPDPWSSAARILWWAAGACTAIAVTIGIWTSIAQPAGADFADDLEQTILASSVDTTVSFDAEFRQ